MDEVVKKISSYNIFNYVIPGAIFASISTRLGLFVVLDKGIIESLVWYYFLGLVISRFGSVVLEPVLKKSGFVKYADYPTYLKAAAADPVMQTMVETSNTYRTLTTGLILLLATDAVDIFMRNIGVLPYWQDRILIFLNAVLLLFSFRKQASFVLKRAHHFGGAN